MAGDSQAQRRGLGAGMLGRRTTDRHTRVCGNRHSLVVTCLHPHPTETPQPWTSPTTPVCNQGPGSSQAPQEASCSQAHWPTSPLRCMMLEWSSVPLYLLFFSITTHLTPGLVPWESRSFLKPRSSEYSLSSFPRGLCLPLSHIS